MFKSLALRGLSGVLACAIVAAVPRGVGSIEDTCALWIDPVSFDPPQPYCSGGCTPGECVSKTINQGAGLWTTHCECGGIGTDACSGVFYWWPAEGQWTWYCDEWGCDTPTPDCLGQPVAPWAFRACDCG